MAELPPSEAQNQPLSPPVPQALHPRANTKEGRWGAPSSGGELVATLRAPEGPLHSVPVTWDQSPFCQVKKRPMRRERQLCTRNAPVQRPWRMETVRGESGTQPRSWRSRVLCWALLLSVPRTGASSRTAVKTLHGRELVLGQAGGPAPPGREGGGHPPEARQPRSPWPQSPPTQQVPENLQALRGTRLMGGVSPLIPHRLKAQPPREEVQGHWASSGTGQQAPSPGAPAHLLRTHLLRSRLDGHTLAWGHFPRPPHRAGLGGLWVWFSRGWSE